MWPCLIFFELEINNIEIKWVGMGKEFAVDGFSAELFIPGANLDTLF